MAQKRPAECLASEAVINGRRFCLVLISSHYGKSGVAVFTEVTPENGPDGEPLHDVFQDVGSWETTGGGDVSHDGMGLEATPSVLKVDVMPSDNLSVAEGAAVMNELIAQIGTDWSDSWQEWTP
jgi:hypothetical protein